MIDWMCPSDEVISEYSLGRLGGTELDAFEEHLLVCSLCQTRVKKEDAFRDAVRGARWHEDDVAESE